MVKTFTLTAQENSLRIEVEETGWAKLTLMGDAQTYLGADDIEIVASRLRNYLENGDVRGRAYQGEMNGLPVACLLLLNEAHHALYVAESGSERILFWQNAHTGPVFLSGVMSLSPFHSRQWTQTLAQILEEAKMPLLAA